MTEEACSHDIITVRAGVACNVQVLKFHVLLLWQRFWSFGMATPHPQTCQVNSGSPSWPFKRREQYNKNCLKQIQKWRLYGSDSPSESETMVITAPPIKYHYATVILPCVISNRCQMLQVLEDIRHRPVSTSWSLKPGKPSISKKSFVFSSGATIPTPSQNGTGIFFAKFSHVFATPRSTWAHLFFISCHCWQRCSWSWRSCHVCLADRIGSIYYLD